MQIKKIGSRGALFTFDDGISVYRVRGPRRSFLCDTHLGPLSMAAVKPGMEGRELPPVVFNTHSDWDHVWGNAAFPQALLVAHADCRRRLAERGGYELEHEAERCRGSVEIRLPDLTFQSQLAFPDEGVEMFHAPGHTPDSAVFYDQEDEVLFLGDLVEAPIPYLDDEDIARYLQTLETLRHFPARLKITAHSGVVDTALIESNLRYVEKMLEGREVPETMYRGAEEVHRFNRNNRLLLPLERRMRRRLAERFCYPDFRRAFSDLHRVEPETLKREVERYCAVNGAGDEPANWG